MMYWSESYGQLFRETALSILCCCSFLFWFLLHHSMPVEHVDDGTMLQEQQKQRPSSMQSVLSGLMGLGRKLSSLPSLTSRSTPAAVAREQGIESSLLTHRRKLLRNMLFSFLALFAVAWLVELTLRESSSPQDWLHRNSLSHQVIFTIAWGHYFLQLWEDYETAEFLLTGMNARLAAKALYPFCRVEASKIMLISCTFQNLLSFGIMTFTLFFYRLPGLGVACLFLEAPRPLLLWRENGLASNTYPVWLMRPRSVRLFWCCCSPILLFRFLLPVLWVLMFADVLKVEFDMDTWIIIHTLSGIFFLTTIRLMFFLRVAYLSDARLLRRGAAIQAMTKKAMKSQKKENSGRLTYRVTVGKFVPKEDDAITAPDRTEADAVTATTLKHCFGKTRSFLNPEEELDAERNPQIPLCFVNELPPVPKEGSIAATKAVTVASSPIPNKGREETA